MSPARSIAKSIIYGAIDLSTGGRGVPRRINGEPFRFPARWSRYYESGYERSTFDFLRANCAPGSTALDIGAHIGLFSVVMARLVGPTGRVFGFEPTPFTRKVLEQTVRLNGCEGIVSIRDEAVSKTSGTTTFYDTDDPISNANSLVQTERSRTALAVKMVSIDDFVREHCGKIGCIKLDVEGAELQALRGAARTFAESRPVLHLSLHPNAIVKGGGTLGMIWDVLRDYRMDVRQDSKPVDGGWFQDRQELFDVTALPA